MISISTGPAGKPACLSVPFLCLVVLAGCSGAAPATSTPVPVVTYSLTINSTNPTSGVSVTASPADNRSVSTESTSTQLTYNANTSVTLTAPAMSGLQVFSGWSGCTQSSGLACTVALSANTTVTANYIAPVVTYVLTVNSTSPASGVSITASPADNKNVTTASTSTQLTYNANTSVTLTAPATAGLQVFSGWSGCTQSSGQTCTVSLSSNTNVTANYIQPVVTLTINSTNPASGVLVTAAPADNKNVASAYTSLQLTYNANTSVTLSAPATTGLEVFSGWSGCTQSSGQICTLALSTNTTVTANYKTGVVVTMTPANPTAVIGTGLQFNALVQGSTASGAATAGVTWTVAASGGSTASPGTITTSGLYQTPYPSPASVVVTATSVDDSSVSASSTITLNSPALAAGPALTVDTSAITHAISPLIYGMNSYTLTTALQSKLHIPVDRWGGDATTRYNYQLDITNSASDYYYENGLNSNTAYPAVSDFNTQVLHDEQYASKTLASVPLIGWTTKRVKACSFSVAKYGAQKSVDKYNPDCGLGVKLDGTQITGNDPADTSIPIDQTFVSGWLSYLVSRFGAANSGGVSLYQLDNEPEYYSSVHRDVHPTPMSYDEVTGKGITYAKTIKAIDPSALVSGPAISNWDSYFYSWADMVHGWSTGPCYCYNGSPTDRIAHGDIPLLAYYLQQFKAAELSGGKRLLDYIDIHTYFAAPGAAFQLAGDTKLQAVRLNSTRVFWDPAYTDPAYTDPSVRTSAAPAYPLQLIPMLTTLAAANYPGTKTAITEYAWGGQESINGAVAQVDILGIFGKFGLDMGLLWGPPDPVTQVPGVMAFQIFQNYDGNGSGFGDGSLAATTGDQSKLAIYAAKRSADGVITILVLNKSFGDLTSTVTLQTTAVSAKAYRYGATDLGSIAALGDQVVTPVAGGGGHLGMTFPAQSITLFTLPY